MTCPDRRSGRTAARAWLVLAVVLLLTACGAPRDTVDVDPDGSQRWQNGRLFIATGNVTGVYYQLGGGYADVITNNLPGYEAAAEPTGASVENIQRVAEGDSHVAFTVADAAGDAAQGKGAFEGRPQPIRALARIYPNVTQLIVRTDAKIKSVMDLKGKRVSTGSRNSGTEAIATRIFGVAKIDPAKDLTTLALSLPDTVQGMKAGTVDAMFWSGGLPTAGITDLVTDMGKKVAFVPLNDCLPDLEKKYGADVYGPAVIPAASYQIDKDIPTVAVPNLIIVHADMPDRLAAELTRLLFDRRTDLAAVHPEAENIDRTTADQTAPVQLHPGARSYYNSR
ncbi:MAG TPA: TAXI family TRAP transporter solute-binding subunit [Cryptosporangiaceae bacterium]|nr:TAXI family TRAP transporter solute-binding subunit [Cryptosporangiaceae bacterium]